jgi:hypothetical protein
LEAGLFFKLILHWNRVTASHVWVVSSEADVLSF